MSFTIKCNNCGKRNTWDEEDGLGGEKRISIDCDIDRNRSAELSIRCPRCENEIREG